MPDVGRTKWALAEGYIPAGSVSEDRAFVSHEAVCILNATKDDAQIAITLFFADREPVGPYRVTVPARRTAHVRFNDLTDPQPVPRDTDYSSIIESSVPVVVQYTRLDSRNPSIALMSTLAFSA
jgi:hypothetical protein